MVSIPKIIGIISFSVVLGLSLSNAAQARMSPGPCADTNRGQPNLLKCDDETLQGIKTIKGEVLRVDGDVLLIHRFNGQQMQLQIEKTTKVNGLISRGNRIEAKVADVDYQTHVLSVRQLE
ncbi:MAG TPA: hypothetical protein VIW47_06365 [Nitrospiraceae bacterium]|jgi:hypothetical protein